MEAQVAADPTTILTLEMAGSDARYFQGLRQQHFPAALNRVPAHITLFHTLPPLALVRGEIESLSARPRFTMRVTGLRSLGYGVAFSIDSPDAAKLHGALVTAFEPHLTRQDRQPFKPHVVIQNKVAPEKARELKSLLERSFQPFDVEAAGLTVWNYLGGAWQRAGDFPFHD